MHTPLFSSNETYIHFCCIYCTARFSSFFDSTEEDRTQSIDTVPMALEREPDHAFLWVNSRVPTSLDKTKLGLSIVHTAPTLNQQCIAIRRTSLAAFSSCVPNSSPRLMGNPRIARSSLKNSGKLFQTPKSERALLVAMSLSQFFDYPDEFTVLVTSPTAPN